MAQANGKGAYREGFVLSKCPNTQDLPDKDEFVPSTEGLGDEDKFGVDCIEDLDFEKFEWLAQYFLNVVRKRTLKLPMWENMATDLNIIPSARDAVLGQLVKHGFIEITHPPSYPGCKGIKLLIKKRKIDPGGHYQPEPGAFEPEPGEVW